MRNGIGAEENATPSVTEAPTGARRRLDNHSNAAEQDLVGMLFVYCDESGTHLDSEIAVIGGYVSTIEEWCLFFTQWKRLLAHFNIPYIHMKELEHFQGPYKGWNAEKRWALLTKAYMIIRKRTKAGFASAVRQKDFISVVPKQMQTFLGGPYGWCAQAILNQVDEWRRIQRLCTPVSWVFERGHKKNEAKQVNNLFRELTDDAELGMSCATWTFADGDLFPLQSADLLAYEVYRQTVHQFGGGTKIKKPSDFHRREGRALVRKDVDFPSLEIWTGESLKFWLTSLPEHARTPFNP
jgi:hypothetical protein